VVDKVIAALPKGFWLSLTGRRVVGAATRNLALIRELLINVLVQPLFALHWFNPLGHGRLASIAARSRGRVRARSNRRKICSAARPMLVSSTAAGSALA
jgi:hypothetical protein